MSAVSEEAKAYNRELGLENYRWYREHGICPYCKKAYAEPGRTYCRYCMARKQTQNERNDPGRVKRNAYNRERRKALIEKGLCTSCGKRKPIPGHRKCPTCHARDVESKQKYKIIQRIKREADKAREASATCR